MNKSNFCSQQCANQPSLQSLLSLSIFSGWILILLFAGKRFESKEIEVGWWLADSNFSLKQTLPSFLRLQFILIFSFHRTVIIIRNKNERSLICGQLNWFQFISSLVSGHETGVEVLLFGWKNVALVARWISAPTNNKQTPVSAQEARKKN